MPLWSLSYVKRKTIHSVGVAACVKDFKGLGCISDYSFLVSLVLSRFMVMNNGNLENDVIQVAVPSFSQGIFLANLIKLLEKFTNLVKLLLKV